MTKQPNTVPAIDRRSPSADSGGHFHAVSLSGGKDSSYLLLRMIELGMSNGTLADDNEGLTSSNGLYVTDENGQIYLSKLTPATYVITEVTAPDNYKLSSGSKTVFVRAADTQTVSFYDDPLCTLTVLKRDAVTKKPLANAEFSVKYSDGATVGTDNGRYVTGKDGTVTVSGLKPDATVIVTETRAPKGYIKDDAAKSIVVRTGVANSLTFDNEPTTTLIVKKQDSATGAALAGAEFRITTISGDFVDDNEGQTSTKGVYVTDEHGEIRLLNVEPDTYGRLFRRSGSPGRFGKGDPRAAGHAVHHAQAGAGGPLQQRRPQEYDPCNL